MIYLNMEMLLLNVWPAPACTRELTHKAQKLLSLGTLQVYSIDTVPLFREFACRSIYFMTLLLSK